MPVILPADVRAYLAANGTTGQYSDGLIGSNIRTASNFLARRTGRVFEDETNTKVFTTDGKAQIPIPGLRTATAVTQQGTTLTADQTYWLIPDADNSGVYIAIQTRAFQPRDGGAWYLSNPQWFDRGLDLPGRGMYSSLPNDLSITGSWGYASADLPAEYLNALLVHSAWLTIRPKALLANSIVTPEGSQLNYDEMAPEVQKFIGEWSIGSAAVAI